MAAAITFDTPMPTKARTTAASRGVHTHTRPQNARRMFQVQMVVADRRAYRKVALVAALSSSHCENVPLRNAIAPASLDLGGPQESARPAKSRWDKIGTEHAPRWIARGRLRLCNAFFTAYATVRAVPLHPPGSV